MLKDTLVIIPARGGSKRIHKKNIAPLLGRPMIHWPLDVLTELFPSANILLSTDDCEIKKAVECYSIETEYTRPESLSDDYTSSLDIIYHAYDWFLQNRVPVKYVLAVYPTAVLLKRTSILKAFDTLENSSAEAVIAATNFGFPIQRGFRLNAAGLMQFREPHHFGSRSQDLEAFYHDAGQFYLFRQSVVADHMDLSKMAVSSVMLKRSEVVDIDEHEDLELAEIFLKHKNL